MERVSQHLRGEQRVAAEGEEIAVKPDVVLCSNLAHSAETRLRRRVPFACPLTLPVLRRARPVRLAMGPSLAAALRHSSAGAR